MANGLSIARLLITPAFLAVAYRGLSGCSAPEAAVALALYAILCATDAADGIVARTTGRASSLGAWLDLGADAAFVLATYVLFAVLRIAPPWLVALIALKLAEYVVTSHMLASARHNGLFVHDPVGRAAVWSSTMLIGIVLCGPVLGASPGPDTFLTAFTALSIAFVLSCVHRVWMTISASAAIGASTYRTDAPAARRSAHRPPRPALSAKGD